MSSCNPCDPAGCAGVPNSVMLLKKLDSMISDNYTLIVIFFIVMGILSMAFIYFFKSMKTNLGVYWKDKATVKSPSGDNPRMAEDDKYTYYENVKDDPEPVQPRENMPDKTKEFVANMEKTYDEYNKLKTEYIKNTTTKRLQNDDLVDESVLFKKYDDYKYDTDD